MKCRLILLAKSSLQRMSCKMGIMHWAFHKVCSWKFRFDYCTLLSLMNTLIENISFPWGSVSLLLQTCMNLCEGVAATIHIWKTCPEHYCFQTSILLDLFSEAGREYSRGHWHHQFVGGLFLRALAERCDGGPRMHTLVTLGAPHQGRSTHQPSIISEKTNLQLISFPHTPTFSLDRTY